MELGSDLGGITCKEGQGQSEWEVRGSARLFKASDCQRFRPEVRGVLGPVKIGLFNNK